MVESYSCGSLQSTMVASAAWPRVCGDGAVALVSVIRGGGLLAANELHLGRRISSHGVVGCSNFALAHRAASQQVRMSAGGGDGGFRSSLATLSQPSLGLRGVRAGSKLENDREEAVSSPGEEGEEEGVGKRKEGGLVEKIESELGRQFGGTLWFSVLLLCLALFGGVYVFLIVNYADFSDIPILRGPQR